MLVYKSLVFLWRFNDILFSVCPFVNGISCLSACLHTPSSFINLFICIFLLIYLPSMLSPVPHPPFPKHFISISYFSLPIVCRLNGPRQPTDPEPLSSISFSAGKRRERFSADHYMLIRPALNSPQSYSLA